MSRALLALMGLLVTFWVLASLPAPAHAAPAKESTGELLKEDVTKKSSNPFLPPNPSLTLYTIVIFVLLLLVLHKFAWGPMLQGLQKRERSIKEAIEEAKRLRADSARAEASFKAELEKAHAQIPALMEEARRDAAALKEQLKNEANAEIQKERQRLLREIDSAKDHALQEIWTQSANLATLISSKVVGRSLNPDDHHRLIDEAMNELKQSARN
jgi:F-type H+-transporting ATPase subunit b